MATRRLNGDNVLIRTRSRAPYLLPRFDGDAELTVEAACLDRLELTREYLLQSVPRDYEGPIELAHDIGRAHQSAVSLTPFDACCHAFGSWSEGRGEGGIKLTLGSMETGRRWLIDLSVEFRNAHAGGMDGSARSPVRLKLRTAMSPTRLIAHAQMRGISPTCTDWRELLISDIATYDAIAHTTVSGSHDNLRPTQFLQPVALGGMIAEVERFLAAMDALIEHVIGVDLRRERPAHGAWLAAARRWAIRQAEAYWEFGHIDAIEYVRHLRPTLWTLGNDASERAWGPEDGPETIAFTARLTGAIRLALYPKTTDRVRLEVRYLKNPPGNSDQEIPERLQAIAVDATRRANRARCAIVDRLGMARAGTAGDSLDALCDLTMLLQDCYRNRPDRAGDILRLLLSRGGIRCREDEFPVSKAEAQMLKNRGIVTTSPLARHSTTGDLIYSIAARYQPLFELFSGLGEERREAS
ncbi:hypothetical protein [Burkholderia cenocepacia]|uniref:hypothetical protein n=1 Tax=Burkholderia cenocepacia TaxID=95486 RepID=UPI001CF4BA96|nr:hypothetical protein [Burkholderia cenocepacia]MCA8005143.1 hypothetical protein [Burkholderia cenocepacia]